MRHNYSGCALAISLAAVVLCGTLVMAAQTSSADHKQSKKKDRKIDESSTAAPRGQTGIAVEGIVVRPNGKPAKGAEVVLTRADDPNQRWTAKADGVGRFRFEAVLAPGSYLATAAAESLVSAPTKVPVPPKRAVPLRLKLRARSKADRNK